MTDEELSKNIRVFAADNEVPVEQVKVIPKSELVVGEIYQGECRNSEDAISKGIELNNKK